MSCEHKFLNDLELAYSDWEIRTLFIGTFNPNWNSCSNESNWFYGRTKRNAFWCILPTIHEGQSLINGNKQDWINFCKRNRIGITDIITSISDANEDNPIHRNYICKFKDDKLENFDINITNVPQILDRYVNIKQVCITRQTLSEFWEDIFTELFIWKNEHPERVLDIIHLRSPSRGARKGITGNFCEFVSNRWLQQGYRIL
jgi:hypothetical protein